MALMVKAPPFFPVATDALARDAITEVKPDSLYLTNWRGGCDKVALAKLKVTHIAAIGDEFLEDEMEGITYYKQNIEDNEAEASKMGGSLRDAASFISSAIKGGNRVLVHCAAGASRSATVVLAYLVLHEKTSLRDAFGELWRKRPCTWPNDGFMGALISLEKEAGGSGTIELAEYVAWGDYQGPEEGEEAPLPLPVLLRLQRKDTCLDAEILARDAIKTAGLAAVAVNRSSTEAEARELEVRDQLGGLRVAPAPPARSESLPTAAELRENGITKLSLTRSDRKEQARRMSVEARERHLKLRASISSF